MVMNSTSSTADADSVPEILKGEGWQEACFLRKLEALPKVRMFRKVGRKYQIPMGMPGSPASLPPSSPELQGSPHRKVLFAFLGPTQKTRG